MPILPLVTLLLAAGGTGEQPSAGPCPASSGPAAAPAAPAAPAARGDSAGRHRAARLADSDRLLRALMPVLWSNDYAGVTVALRAQPTCVGRAGHIERGLFIGSAATRGSATSAVSLYARWNNPLDRDATRVTSSVAAWSVEGRSGAAISLVRFRQSPGAGAEPRVGLDALWMATTNLGYVDRRLWDDAGTIEVAPWMRTVVRKGGRLLRTRLGARIGTVFQHAAVFGSEGRYHYEGFVRLSGEMSMRAPAGRGTTLGARVFGGAYLGPSPPVRQLRIPVAGADPYETFTNPFLRSRGALLVRPDFYYHVPGSANLRGFRNDLGGRWAVGVNLELTRAVLRRDAGVLREAAFEAFVDLGLVDTLVVRSSPPGGWYTTLYDGGIGIVTRHQVKDLAWTMRFELPIAVNRWSLAADSPADSKRFALRWQVSFSPSF